jgi:hypothetical protein
MEVQTVLASQRAKIDVHRSPESVPARKSLSLLALEIPEGIADVLKIEFHTALQQMRPLAAPVPEEVSMRALTRFVAVWAGEWFVLRSLGMSRRCEHTNSAPE